MEKNIAAIILAAGKGKRMNSQDINKVTLSLGGIPMIVRSMNLFKSLGISTIVVVVGFAKESVIKILGDGVEYAYQESQLGTADAVMCGLKKIPGNIENVLVVNGDDSAFYKRDTIEKLIQKHFSANAALTFLTTERDNPYGIGRVVRAKNKEIIKVVEEKDADDEEKQIKEINVGCYIFKKDFLSKYLPLLEKSSATGEYYLTGLIELARRNGEKTEAVKDVSLLWHGVNTPEELKKAEHIYKMKYE